MFMPMLSQESQGLFHANIGRDRTDAQALTFVSGSGKNKLRNSVAIADAPDKGPLDLLWSWDADNNP
jgi:ABC-type iron transport system FetAB ATPase subunit